jgi:predicted dienelactone hydrolase
MRDLSEYAARGPYPVGVASLVLADAEKPGRRVPVDVWYPADVQGWRRAPAAAHPIGAPHDARADAPPLSAERAGDPLPVVAFSHGNSGFARQSTFLTTHLASWGMLVAAPDHTGNTFFEMLGVADEDERIRIHKAARADRPRDLAAALEAVLGGGAWPLASPDRVGVLGHSFGGWTALKLPRRDARVRAVCGLAPVSEPFVGRKAFEAGELPFANAIPTLIVSARDDVLVDLETSVRPLAARLAEPRALVVLRDADHFHFCDHLELIHGLHEKNPRPRQTRATRAYAELLPEARAHRLLAGLVTGFFAHALGARAPGERPGLPDLSREALAALDPALELDPLEPEREAAAG